MHPQRRVKRTLEGPGHGDEQKAEQKYKEDGSAIADVMVAELCAAFGAGIDDGDRMPLKQRRCPANRAARIEDELEVFG